MITPDNELYDAVFALLLQDGLPVYDIAPEDPISHMPLIVVGQTQLLTQETKTLLVGRVAITLDVWGGRKQRWDVAQMTSKVFQLLSNLESSEHYKWKIRQDQTLNTVYADKYDNTDEWHGQLDLTYVAY